MEPKQEIAVLGVIVLVILALLLGGEAHSAELRLLDVEYVGVEYRQHRNYRDSYYSRYETIEGQCVGTNADGTDSDECMRYGANALFDLSLIRYGKYSLGWRNDVGMDATNKQVRQVGWHWELGVFTPKVEFFSRHHSRHVMEDVNENYNYPLRDEYVIRFNLYRRSDK